MGLLLGGRLGCSGATLLRLGVFVIAVQRLGRHVLKFVQRVEHLLWTDSFTAGMLPMNSIFAFGKDGSYACITSMLLARRQKVHLCTTIL